MYNISHYAFTKKANIFWKVSETSTSGCKAIVILGYKETVKDSSPK